ncbi:MAG: hypothetical protein CR967_03595 [Proteobacteria bacterium]|nr:MAG: hypothetical protein CR967_03595 [Pseudomonadota bacterium]
MTFQELPNAKKKKSHIWILPLSFEKTVCGKKGTAKAPKAIIDASLDTEYYEEEYDWSPFKYIRLYTGKNFSRIKNFKKLDLRIKKFLKNHNGQFLLTLGGEHSITPFVTKHLLPANSTIIFFDAHGDFRKTYLGSKNNHACALYNLAKQGHKAIAIGLRSFFDDERQRMDELGIKCFTDFDLQKKSKQKELFKGIKNLKSNVYISIDMDCFSPGFVSGVGTPLPGGIEWFFFLKILKSIFENKNINILGADIVELLPEKSKVSQVIAAKIMQKIFSYWGKSKGYDKLEQKGSQMDIDYE